MKQTAILTLFLLMQIQKQRKAPDFHPEPFSLFFRVGAIRPPTMVTVPCDSSQVKSLT